MEFLKRALQTLERSEDGQAAWLTLSYDLLSETTAYPEETEGIIQYAQMIAGVELAVVFRETEPGEVRVSFRSRSRFDVSALAREFGGGGARTSRGLSIASPSGAGAPGRPGSCGGDSTPVASFWGNRFRERCG